MNILIRTDSGYKMGIGHLMRCYNLSLELIKIGHQVTFLTKEHPGNLIAFIDEHPSLTVLRLPLSSPHDDWSIKDDLIKCKQVYKSVKVIDLLIIDHYGIDHEWERLAIFEEYLPVKKVMVIDDLYNRPHYCHYLLDQTYRSDLNNNPYLSLVSKPLPVKFLLGSDYCLLNNVFFERRQELLSQNKLQRNSLRRVNIAMGGVDALQITYQIVKILVSAPAAQGTDVTKTLIHYDIILGKHYPEPDKIKTLISDQPNFQIYQNLGYDQITDLISESDLAIGAGGVSVYERCVLGVPSILITCAENQFPNAHNLSRAGVVTYLGHYDQWMKDHPSKKLLTALEQYQSSDLLKRQSHLAQKLIDGLGCQRVAKIITQVN